MGNKLDATRAPSMYVIGGQRRDGWNCVLTHKTRFGRSV